MRELENENRARGAAGDSTDVLQADSLPSHLWGGPELRTPSRACAAGPGPAADDGDRAPGAGACARPRRSYNMTHAAQALGINRTTLYRKLKRYHLSATG